MVLRFAHLERLGSSKQIYNILKNLMSMDLVAVEVTGHAAKRKMQISFLCLIVT